MLIYKLRNQMPLADLVGKQASPVALYSYIWQAELHKGFCPHFPSLRLYEDKWLNASYGQGYLTSDPQPLAMLQ